MRRRQPSRLAAVLACVLTLVCTVAKVLERRAGTSEIALYILLGLALVLAAAYLVSLFLAKKGRGGVPGKGSGVIISKKTPPETVETDDTAPENSEEQHG